MVSPDNQAGSMVAEMRDYLRTLPVFAGAIGEFDTDDLPVTPAELFSGWLREAVDAGVPEPHAMTLSTTDSEGNPDARILILKDVDDRGWWFASNSLSPKGVQLSGNPHAALSFYWPAMARQVRVRGPVITGSPELSAADFRSRGSGAKAIALASQESTPLQDRATCEAAVESADRRLAAQPDLVSPSWQVYAVVPAVIEFWQADKDRQHIRVQYRREGEAWSRTLLWP